MNADYYKIEPIENINFSPEDLKRMGIFFIDDLSQLQSAVDIFGIRMSIGTGLADHGFMLSLVGPIEDPFWALYSTKHNLEYVLDFRDGKNFYSITFVNGETKEETKIFDKIHVRENHVKEDIEYYINLDLEARNEHEVYSEILQ